MSDSSGIGSGSSSDSSSSSSDNRRYRPKKRIYLGGKSKGPITKKQLHAKVLAICRRGDWKQLKQEIVVYNQKRDSVISEMENHTDQVFREYLRLCKTTLGAKVFHQHRLVVYAFCNKLAMCRHIPLDELLKDTPIPILVSSDSESSSDEEN